MINDNCKPNSTNIPILNLKKFQSGKKVIGEIRLDTLTKRVNGSIHMLRNPKGWAIDKTIVFYAKKSGTRFIEILDKETNIVYSCTLDFFIKNGIEINRGYGTQIVLVIEKWIVTEPVQKRTLQHGLF